MEPFSEETVQMAFAATILVSGLLDTAGKCSFQNAHKQNGPCLIIYSFPRHLMCRNPSGQHGPVVRMWAAQDGTTKQGRLTDVGYTDLL